MKQPIEPVRRSFSFADRQKAVLSPEKPFEYDYAPVPRADEPASAPAPMKQAIERVTKEPRKKTNPPAKVLTQGTTLSAQVRIAVPVEIENLSQTLGRSIARQLAEKIETAVNHEIATNGCDPSKFAKVTASKHSLRCTIGTTAEVTTALQASYGEFAEKALVEFARRMAPQIVAKFLPD